MIFFEGENMMMTVKNQQDVKSRSAERGFGLVEAMIAAVIISIIALGISTLVQDMLMVQKKSSVVGVIHTLRTKIISTVQNGESWQFNVNNLGTGTNTEMACLRAGGPQCDRTSIVGDLNLVENDAALTPIYMGGVANHGFNLDGTFCTTYPSDACPFRYVLRWVPTCPGGAAVTLCSNPNIQVTGVFEHTPGSFHLPGGFNPQLYAIDVRRGTDAIRNDAVTVSFVTSGTAGEGPCHTGWVTRQLNTAVADVGENLQNKTGAAPSTLSTPNQIWLKAGTYNCRIQAPAFKSGGNRLRLVSIPINTIPTVESSTVTASLSGGGSATLVIETTLILNSDARFEVQQTCTHSPVDPLVVASPDPLQTNWGLGVPLSSDPGYTNVTYTTVTCARTS